MKKAHKNTANARVLHAISCFDICHFTATSRHNTSSAITTTHSPKQTQTAKQLHLSLAYSNIEMYHEI